MNSNTISDLLEGIFDIKEKITDQEYRNLMEVCHKLHKCDTTAGFIKDENKEFIEIYSYINLEMIQTNQPCYRINEEYVIVKKDEMEEAIHNHVSEVMDEIDRAYEAGEIDIASSNISLESVQPTNLDIDELSESEESGEE